MFLMDRPLRRETNCLRFSSKGYQAPVVLTAQQLFDARSGGHGGSCFVILEIHPKGISPQHESRNSPRLRRNQRNLRLRSHVQNALDSQGRYPRGNLLQLPPVFHRTSEADGHRGPRREVREEVSEVQKRKRRTSPQPSGAHAAAVVPALRNPCCSSAQTLRPQAIVTPTSGIRLPGGVVQRSTASWDGDWPVRVLSPSGRWLARIPTQWELEGPIQIELLQTDSGTVSGTMTLPRAAGQPETRVYRQSVTMSFIDDSKLIVVYHQSVNGTTAKQKRLLIVETHSVPDGGSVAPGNRFAHGSAQVGRRRFAISDDFNQPRRQAHADLSERAAPAICGSPPQFAVSGGAVRRGEWEAARVLQPNLDGNPDCVPAGRNARRVSRRTDGARSPISARTN